MTNIFLIPTFICSFIYVFFYLKANIRRDVACQAAPLRWWSGRYLVDWPATCWCRFTLLAKTSEIQRVWLFVYEFRSLKLQGRGFFWCSSLIRVFLWNFACSAFLMVLQRNRLLQKKVDHVISPSLQQRLFAFYLSVWLFPDELDGKTG